MTYFINEKNSKNLSIKKMCTLIEVENWKPLGTLKSATFISI